MYGGCFLTHYNLALMEKLVCIRNQTEKFISIDIPKYGGFF